MKRVNLTFDSNDYDQVPESWNINFNKGKITITNTSETRVDAYDVIYHVTKEWFALQVNGRLVVGVDFPLSMSELTRSTDKEDLVDLLIQSIVALCDSWGLSYEETNEYLRFFGLVNDF